MVLGGGSTGVKLIVGKDCASRCLSGIKSSRSVLLIMFSSLFVSQCNGCDLSFEIYDISFSRL